MLLTWKKRRCSSFCFSLPPAGCAARETLAVVYLGGYCERGFTGRPPADEACRPAVSGRRGSNSSLLLLLVPFLRLLAARTSIRDAGVVRVHGHRPNAFRVVVNSAAMPLVRPPLPEIPGMDGKTTRCPSNKPDNHENGIACTALQTTHSRTTTFTRLVSCSGRSGIPNTPFVVHCLW